MTYFVWNLILFFQGMRIGRVAGKVKGTTFRSGEVGVTLNLDYDVTELGQRPVEDSAPRAVSVKPELANFTVSWKAPARSAVLSIKLSGGDGQEAWQHAQLLRESLDQQDLELRNVFLLELDLV